MKLKIPVEYQQKDGSKTRTQEDIKRPPATQQQWNQQQNVIKTLTSRDETEWETGLKTSTSTVGRACGLTNPSGLASKVYVCSVDYILLTSDISKNLHQRCNQKLLKRNM